MKISVSFLKSIYNLNETIKKIEETNADFIHVDIMDGIFVESKTIEVEECINLLAQTKKPLDVHLMMNEENTTKAIEKLSKLTPKYLTVHGELENLESLVAQIKKHNIKVGLALNPETAIDVIAPYLKLVDMVLIMSVHPGKGGQTFIHETILKLQKLKQICDENKVRPVISIDGGINKETVQLIKNYCDVAVSGSFICMQENYQTQINKLR